MKKEGFGSAGEGRGHFDSERTNKKTRLSFFLLFLFFIALLGSFLYYAYNGSDTSFGKGVFEKVTGSNSNVSVVGDIKISASLNPSKISIKGNVDRIELVASVNDFKFGSQDFNLKNKKTSLIIDNFNGKMDFDGVNITSFKGKANRVSVDGLPISSNKSLDISFDDGTYDHLKLTNINLDSLSYETSGRISLNDDKVVLNPNKEKISIIGFNGNLESRINKFIFTGTIKKSSLTGDLDVSLG